jgi:hypothetical protein
MPREYIVCVSGLPLFPLVHQRQRERAQKAMRAAAACTAVCARCHLFISKAALKQWCQLLDPSIYKTSKTFHFAFKHSHRIVYAAAADNCALSTRTQQPAHNAHTLLFGRQFRRPVFINAAPRLAQPPSRNCVDAASEKLPRPDASEVSRQKIYTRHMQRVHARIRAAVGRSPFLWIW